MIITELDKAWCRAATAKLIRQGKLKRRPCEICGARETLVHHADYSDPEHIKWLCKRHKSEEGLSALQRTLLRYGLMAHYCTSLDLACRLPDVGSFRLQALMMEYEDPRVRASRRAAAGLSIARLIKRGLLECPRPGRWRLTPENKPPTKRELARHIALRKALSGLRDRLRPRKRAKRRERAKISIGDLIQRVD